MAKDKGTTLPITQLSGLMVNYTDENSTLNPPSMTTVQRNALVNTDANKVNPLLKVKEGTQIYNTDPTVQKVQIMQGGKWVNVGVGAVPSSFNTLVFNNNPNNTGNPIGSVKNQSVVFQGEDGQNIMPAVNANNQPVGVGGFKIEAPFLTKRNQKKRCKNLQSLPSDITGLFGIGAVDFSEGEGFGFVTCEEQQFITLNIQPLTLKQNILLTDDPEDSDPSSPNYNAIVEIRSDVGGFQLPRLSAEILANMDTDPINDLGLMAYNTDSIVNAPVIFNGETFVPLGGGGIQSIQAGTNITIDYADPANPIISATGEEGLGDVTSTATSTQNTQIAIFADNTGKIIKNSGTTISSNVISTGGISASGNINSLNVYTQSLGLRNNSNPSIITLRGNSSIFADYTLSFPAESGSINQTLILTDNEGTLDWITVGEGSGNVFVDASTTAKYCLPIFSADGSSTLVNSGILLSSPDNTSFLQLGSGEIGIGLPGKILNSISLTDNGLPNFRPFIIFESNGFTTTLQSSSSLDGRENWTMTLPANSGENLQVLVTDGEGTTYWTNSIITFGTPEQSGINIDYTNPQNPSISLEFASVIGGSTDILPGGPNIGDAAVSSTTCVQFHCPIAFQTDPAAYFTITDIGSHSFVSLETGSEDVGKNSNDPVLPYYNIVAPHNIMAYEFDAVSSINVKNVLERGKTVTKEVYDLFKKINLVKYEYKDKIKAGIGTHYGLIAEEFREIMPHMVHNHQDFIPNIMCLGEVTYKDPQNIIVLLNEDKQLDILIDKQIKLFTNSGEIYGVVTSNLKETINIKLDKEYPELNQVFVYGTKESCPVVAKDRLPEISLCVAKYQDELIENLMDRCAKLEQKLGV